MLLVRTIDTGVGAAGPWVTPVPLSGTVSVPALVTMVRLPPYVLAAVGVKVTLIVQVRRGGETGGAGVGLPEASRRRNRADAQRGPTRARQGHRLRRAGCPHDLVPECEARRRHARGGSGRSLHGVGRRLGREVHERTAVPDRVLRDDPVVVQVRSGPGRIGVGARPGVVRASQRLGVGRQGDPGRRIRRIPDTCTRVCVSAIELSVQSSRTVARRRSRSSSP